MVRLVIVSNRVSPITTAHSNPGGLAIAVRAALDQDRAMWFGWSGKIVESSPTPPRLVRDGRLTRALIDLSREDYERYYTGFANCALWPLFHYRTNLVEFEHEDYAGYRRVNEEFARHLVALLRPDDLIWVHDYHLIPLGAFLRARGINHRIGFFLHTPFPCPGVLTTLPMHEDLVRALSAYDVVGFQTDEDLQAFTDYIEREVHGDAREPGRISAFGRTFHAGVFPVGIDPETTAERSSRALNLPQCHRLFDSLAGRQLVIGVDRLDYTKGLLNRFKAVKLLLEGHPEHRRCVVVLQIAPPTRGDVPEYQQLRSALDALTGHINGRFGAPDLQPVRYLNRQFGQDTLFGFYRLSAVGLVTPLRDGMNLVAKEFVASQDPENPGVLILSRFAGAARQLDAAMIVNPYDPAAIASALDRALTMPLDERRVRHRSLMQGLRRHDIKAWRRAFLDLLSRPGMSHGTTPAGSRPASREMAGAALAELSKRSAARRN